MPSSSPGPSQGRAHRRTFSRWLAAQVARDDAVGRLARGVKADADRSGLSPDAYRVRLQQLSGLDDPMREVLFEAIVEWGVSDG